MEYRKLGSSDLKVSAITFGAWAIGGWMWGGVEREDAVAAIKASYNLGITSIDTAPLYGLGLSEQIIGDIIGDIPRDQVQILSKYGMRWDLKKGKRAFTNKGPKGNIVHVYKYAGKESIIQECERSLKRLKTDYIDLYQIHWPDLTTPIEESMEAVLQLKEQGKIREAGVCNYDITQMQSAEKMLCIVSNQVPYSMINRSIEQDIIPHCIKNKKSILAYSPLQRGLLTGKFKPDHHFKKGDHRASNPFFTSENIAQVAVLLEQIRPIAVGKNSTLGQLVIAWTMAQPGITSVLVGARNEQQALQNAKAIEVKLSTEEIAQIDKCLKACKNFV